MGTTETGQPNLLKWIMIGICGIVVFAYSTLFLSFLRQISYLFDYSGPEKLFNDLIVMGIMPISFLITLAYFYATHMDLLVWLTWELLWTCILYLTYVNRKIWSPKTQLMSHGILASSAIITFILWNILLIPEKLGIPSVYDVQILDPFYSIQVCWIIPLWFIIWFYGWLIDVPQDFIKRRKWNRIQIIWFILFIISQLYVVIYLGEYIWWIPSQGVF